MTTDAEFHRNYSNIFGVVVNEQLDKYGTGCDIPVGTLLSFKNSKIYFVRESCRVMFNFE